MTDPDDPVFIPGRVTIGSPGDYEPYPEERRDEEER